MTFYILNQEHFWNKINLNEWIINNELKNVSALWLMYLETNNLSMIFYRRREEHSLAYTYFSCYKISGENK